MEKGDLLEKIKNMAIAVWKPWTERVTGSIGRDGKETKIREGG